MQVPASHPWQDWTKSALWWSLGIFALNLLLKGLYLGAPDIALDEPFTLFHAQQTLPELLDLFPRENNPPLHFLVTHLQIQLFGLDPVSVRFPSLLFSSLTAVVLLRSGWRHFDWATGVLAALVFSLSTLQTYFAHEARTFALLSLLAILSTDRFLRLFREPGNPWHLFWMGLWTVLAMYSHFLGFWLVIAQGVAFWWLPQKRLLWKGFALMYLGVGLIYLPFAYVLYLRLGVYSSGGGWLWQPQWTELYGNINRFLNGRWTTGVLFAVLLLAAAWRTFHGNWAAWWTSLWEKSSGWALVAMWATIYGGMFVVSFAGAAMFLDRYLLLTTPLLYLSLAWGLLAKMPDRRWQMGAVGALLLAMALQLDLNPSNHREISRLVEQVRSDWDEQTAVVIAPRYLDKAFAYHFDREAFADYRHFDDWKQTHRIFAFMSRKGLPQLDPLGLDKVYFMDADAHFTLPDNGLAEGLRERFAREKTWEYDGKFRLFRFSEPR